MIRRRNSDHIELVNIDLWHRQKLLNEKFVWNEGVVERILQLNQKIFDCEKLLYKEYESRKKELEDREAANDPFLTDYNIDMAIKLYIYTLGEDGEWEEPKEGSIYDIFNGLLKRDAGMIPVINYRNKELLNWAPTRGEAKKYLENHFIHYAFHCMYDHAYMAWEDILKVNCIWSEVNVDYQRIIDLFEAETNQK